MTDKRNYFETLDGFRGMAVIFILLFHSSFNYFRVLWIGVPMFFVLSGFLITRILIENKYKSNYFKVFYIRRSLRIFPVYYLILFVCIVWGLKNNLDLSQWPVYFFLLQNFFISGDIVPEFCSGFLRHTWSISVEEIFYLCWPPLVYFSREKTLSRLCLISGVASILFKLFYVLLFYKPNEEPFLMLSLIGNMDSLMAGSFLGILSVNKKSDVHTFFLKKLFLFVFIVFCFVIIFNYLPVLGQRNAYLMKVLLSSFTVLISFFIILWLIVYDEINAVIHKLLTAHWLVFSGKISYGIYIYHNLVYRSVDSFIYRQEIMLPAFFIFLVQISLTIAMSVVSWHFIEQPFLKLKSKVTFKE